MRVDYIKPSVYKKIYMIMQYENALALRTSLETGLRIGDVLRLRPQDIDGRTITLTAQKTGKECSKVLSADLCKRLSQIAGKEWVFEGRFGDKPRTRGAVWKDVKKAAKVLKLTENVGCHSARKTYAVELFHSEGLPEVQKELQHDHTDTTMLYAFADLLSDKADSASDDELADRIAEKVWQKLEQKFLA